MQVEVREGEPVEKALRRFRRAVERAGILKEVRKRAYYEKPSVQKRRKWRAAAKRRRRVEQRARRRFNRD